MNRLEYTKKEITAFVFMEKFVPLPKNYTFE